MSRPAASCALMIAATASRYCSRNSESPSIVLNERPCRLESYHNGRGYDPVIAVGRIMSRVVVSMADSDRGGGDAKGETIASLGCCAKVAGIALAGAHATAAGVPPSRPSGPPLPAPRAAGEELSQRERAVALRCDRVTM